MAHFTGSDNPMNYQGGSMKVRASIQKDEEKFDGHYDDD